MSHRTQPGICDGPWYRVRTEQFEAATIITLAQVELLMKRWAGIGEALGGRYFFTASKTDGPSGPRQPDSETISQTRPGHSHRAGRGEAPGTSPGLRHSPVGS
jgi:hypothetical protein